MTQTDDLEQRLREHAGVPSAYLYAGDKIEALFDPGLRHKPGKKPTDYLRQWLSMLRPFAYATRDDSWGEMEKLLCIVMRNYVQMKRLSAEAADDRSRLRAENEALREALAALRLQALQSDLNDPANEWGWEALQLANIALKGSRHE